MCEKKPLDGQIWMLTMVNSTNGLRYNVVGFHYAGHWFGTQRTEPGHVVYRNMLRGFTPVKFIGESL